MGADDHQGPALERQVQRGFLHTHTGLSQNHDHLLQLASTVFAMVDLFVERGLLSLEEVQAQARLTRERLAQSELGRGFGFVLQKDPRDKYDHPDTLQVDCQARHPLCQSACCSLDVPLASQDIEEGVLRFDLGRPYLLRRSSDGCCEHLSRGSGACGVYQARPLACRSYSCADDPRIWKDFAARIPNTESIQQLLARPDGPRRRIAEPESAVTAPVIPGQDTGSAP